MGANFQVGFHKKDGNLYIDPRGEFDGSSAWELANLIHDRYDGSGLVVIDTQRLCKLCPFGCSTFKCCMRLGRVPANRLLIKGALGYAIAPDGCKVQVDADVKSHHCGGRCENCRCKLGGK